MSNLDTDEVYVVIYGSNQSKQIIESGVMLRSEERARAWAERYADGDAWRIEPLSRIDPHLDVM